MSLKDFYSSLSSNEFVADDTVIDENAVEPLITSPEVDLTDFIGKYFILKKSSKKFTTIY